MNNSLFFSPTTIKELKKSILNNQDKQIIYLAGCSDFMVHGKKDTTNKVFVDLLNIKELAKIKAKINSIIIGATASISEILMNQCVREFFPVLIKALKSIGSIQIKNHATIGGNIANASPAGDSIPCLMVLEAKLIIENIIQQKVRKEKITEFFIGPGETKLENGDLIKYIEIPKILKSNTLNYFRKVGQRNAVTISKTSLSGICKINDVKVQWIRLACGSVAPIVLRLYKTENFLNNQTINQKIISKAKMILKSEINPITDIRSNKKYRKEITANLLEDFLTKDKS